MQFANNPEEVVKGLLYKGEVFCLAGCPSAGKTRNQLHMFNGLATGAKGWWGQYDPMKVLYCSQRDWRFTSAQFRTVGVESIPDNFKVFCTPDLDRESLSFFRSNPTGYVKDKILRNFNPDVIGFDCLWNFLPKEKGKNFNDYNTLSQDCENLVHWTKQINSALSALHHASKQKENAKYDNPMDRILGSQAILACTVAAGVIEKVDYSDNTFVRIHFMSHLQELSTPRFFRADRFSEVDEAEIVQHSNDKLKATITMQDLGPVEKDVLDQVPRDFINYTDLAILCEEKFSIKTNHVYKVLDRLAKKGFLVIEINKDTGYKQARRAKTL